MTPSDPQRTRRNAVRRHRRERQILVFGILIIVVGAIAFFAASVYRGDVQGPFNAAFVTPETDFTSDVTLVCPPASSLPLETSQVAVRVLNSTEKPGVAARTRDDLEGRGFVPLGAGNFARPYEGTAKILLAKPAC